MEADISRIIVCEQVQEHFLEQKHKLFDQELIDRLKQRGMRVKRLDSKRKREQEGKIVKRLDPSSSTHNNYQTEEIDGIVQI